MHDPSNPERVVVISDLHMAAKGRGIFSAQKELAAFIEHVAGWPESVDFVVLGDALDYLQVEPFLDFTPGAAKAKTEAIVDNNKEVFAALAGLVKAGKRVRWCVGNHDLELVFKGAQEVLADAILGPSGGAAKELLEIKTDGGRIDYAMHGGGTLRLVHGNTGDAWNAIDYEAATAVADAGGSASFVYPPGSKLVAEVLNPLKDEGFIHIDLLKPEATVALPLTLALWPESTQKYLKSAFPAFFASSGISIKARLEKIFGGVKPKFGGALPDAAAKIKAAPTPEDLLAIALRDAFAVDAAKSADVAESASLQKGLASLLAEPQGAKMIADALTSEGQPGKNFSGSWAKSLIARALRGSAYNANQVSNIWSVEQPDELDEYVQGTFKDTNAKVLVVVAGHTHLGRAVSYSGGFYINTGTWANLMRIPAYFQGAEFAEHSRSLRDYFAHPESAPAELRPFQRFTYADIDLRPTKDGPTFNAKLCEWIPRPARVLGQFP